MESSLVEQVGAVIWRNLAIEVTASYTDQQQHKLGAVAVRTERAESFLALYQIELHPVTDEWI